MIRKLLLLFLFVAVSFSGFGQITFTQSPSRLQLFPRGVDDSSTVALSGAVTQSQYTHIIYTFHKNGIISDSSVIPLSFSGSSAPFAKNYRIKAGKTLHNFRLYLWQGSAATQVLRADSVVSGDVYIIMGQSNAQANATVAGVDAPYLWIRSFGNQSDVPSVAQADTTWGIAQGSSGAAAYSIGVWGMRLARMLTDTFNIPICMINGARPGTNILEHLPAANPLDLNTLYGRLLYRVQKAEVNQDAKAMFWYQGESDGSSTNAPLYASRFDQLRSAWFTHYPSIQRIYVVQTRPGCINGAPEHRQVREAHRSFPYIYPEVRVMSSVAIPGFDGCHFNVSGYKILGGFLYKQVVREHYGIPQPVTADPPDIVSAFFTDSSNTKLSIVFNQPVFWPALYNGYDLKDYIYLNTPVTVTSGSSSGDTVKLTLSATSNAYKITYLPNQYYNNTTINYDGPWLTGGTAVGALSFYSFPLNNQVTISAAEYTLCNGSGTVITANKTGQTYQWYYNNALVSGATSYNLAVSSAGQYYVIVTDANGISVTSNTVTITQVSGGSVPQIVSNTGSFEFCGGSITLSTDIPGNSYLWSNGSTASSINVSSSGTYSVTVYYAAGCSGTSQPVNVINHSTVLPTLVYSSSTFCNGDSVLVTPSYGTVVNWSDGSVSQNIYVSQTASVSVTITDSSGCTVSSMPVNFTEIVPSVPVISAADSVFCFGDSLLLSATSSSAYLWSTGGTTQSVYIKDSAVVTVTVTDNSGCKATSLPFRAYENISFQPFITGNAHACTGQTIQLSTSGYSSYFWSTGATTSSITVSVSGNYTVTATDIYGCTGSSIPFAADISSPTVSISPNGTYDLCSGKKLPVVATSATATAWQWQKNNSNISGATSSVYSVGGNGAYRVRVTDASGCTAFSSSLTVMVRSTPTASFTIVNQFDVCNDSLVTLTANNGTGLTYQWQRNKINMPSETTQLLYTQSKGEYRVVVSNQYGCSKTSSHVAIPIPNPVASFMVVGSTTICIGDSVQLTANEGTGYIYQWQKSGVNIAGATNRDYYAKVSGSYRVRVYNSMGCSATSGSKSITATSCGARMQQNNKSHSTVSPGEFLLYPNPVSDQLYIVPPEATEGTVTYRLADADGRTISSGTLAEGENVISTSELRPGIYIMRFEGAIGRKTYKVEKSISIY